MVICIDLHLEVLSWRPALEEEVRNFKRSLWCWVASVTELISLKSIVSLANIAMFELVTAEVRSLSYSKRSIGPRMNPSGTPEETKSGWDVTPNAIVCS